MKKRKNFGEIVVQGRKYLYSFAHLNTVSVLPKLIIYTEQDERFILDPVGTEKPTWRGKKAKGPQWGPWGKAEASASILKWLGENAS